MISASIIFEVVKNGFTINGVKEGLGFVKSKLRLRLGKACSNSFQEKFKCNQGKN